MRSWLLVLAIALGTSGCVFSLSPANVGEVTPQYSKPMVATKSAVPVRILLGTALPDDMVLTGVQPGSVHQVRTIVTRDLRDALSVFFTNVTVVNAASAQPATGEAILVDVQMTELGYEPHNGGKTAIGIMDWSLGMRLAGQREYFYRFTNHAIGQREIASITDTNKLVQGAIEEAMRQLLADMDAKQIARLAEPKPLESMR